jgi:hypothetical protein
MDVLTETEKVVWEDEVKRLDEMAKKELKRLCDFGSPETRRAILIAVTRPVLDIWSPGDENQFRESAVRAFKFLTELLEAR